MVVGRLVLGHEKEFADLALIEKAPAEVPPAGPAVDACGGCGNVSLGTQDMPATLQAP